MQQPAPAPTQLTADDELPPYSFHALGAKLQVRPRYRRWQQRTNPRQPIVVFLEGLIGAGKSELQRAWMAWLLAHGVRVVGRGEPVDDWKRVGILQAFCAHQDRWAAEFQTYVMVTRIEAMLAAFDEDPDADVYMFERSPLSDRWLFMQRGWQAGSVNEMQMHMYDAWWSMWYQLVPYEPTAFVWVHTEVAEAMRRVAVRGRPGEELIPSAYQEQLLALHGTMMNDLKCTPELFGLTTDVRVINVDNARDHREDAAYADALFWRHSIQLGMIAPEALLAAVDPTPFFASSVPAAPAAPAASLRSASARGGLGGEIAGGEGGVSPPGVSPPEPAVMLVDDDGAVVYIDRKRPPGGGEIGLEDLHAQHEADAAALNRLLQGLSPDGDDFVFGDDPRQQRTGDTCLQRMADLDDHINLVVSSWPQHGDHIQADEREVTARLMDFMRYKTQFEAKANKAGAAGVSSATH
jgi:deoxyadenosine/deoxycytidine kinase